MKADTSHIEACRKAWKAHKETCPVCSLPNVWCFCHRGVNLYDEYCFAITANRDCEHLEAKAVE